MKCHACERDALVVYRVVPYQAVTLFDSSPRDVNACAQHLEAAKRIGQVLSVTVLSSDVVTRVVQP